VKNRHVDIIWVEAVVGREETKFEIIDTKNLIEIFNLLCTFVYAEIVSPRRRSGQWEIELESSGKDAQARGGSNRRYETTYSNVQVNIEGLLRAQEAKMCPWQSLAGFGFPCEQEKKKDRRRDEVRPKISARYCDFKAQFDIITKPISPLRSQFQRDTTVRCWRRLLFSDESINGRSDVLTRATLFQKSLSSTDFESRLWPFAFFGNASQNFVSIFCSSLNDVSHGFLQFTRP
jgi:hypothetical protein